METKTEPAPVCITHCGHDPRWTVEGVCREPIGPYLDPNGECGHRCPVHQVATSASDGVTVDPERDFTPTPPDQRVADSAEVRHLLQCLAEECAEVIQACSKALRFGLDDDHQATNPAIVSPRLYIEKELNDLFAVTGLLCDADVLPKPWIDAAKIHAKREKLATMMAYAREKGML